MRGDSAHPTDFLGAPSLGFAAGKEGGALPDFAVQFILYISLLVRPPQHHVTGLAALGPVSWCRVVSALLGTSPPLAGYSSGGPCFCGLLVWPLSGNEGWTMTSGFCEWGLSKRSLYVVSKGHTHCMGQSWSVPARGAAQRSLIYRRKKF